MIDPLARLASLEYFQTAKAPDLSADYLTFDLTAEAQTREVERRYGLVVSGRGARNRLIVHKDAAFFEGRPLLAIAGDDNAVIVEAGCDIGGRIDLEGAGNLAVILGDGGHCHVAGAVQGGSTLVWGRGAFAWGTRFGVQSGTVLTIGDGCLMGLGVNLMTTDFHSIVDLETYEQVNFPADLYIEPHVWLGEGAVVRKGVRIGKGAVIGGQSVVIADVPPRQCWTGVPARCVKTNVSWVRSHPASADDLDALRLILR